MINEPVNRCNVYFKVDWIIFYSFYVIIVQFYICVQSDFCYVQMFSIVINILTSLLNHCPDNRHYVYCLWPYTLCVLLVILLPMSLKFFLQNGRISGTIVQVTSFKQSTQLWVLLDVVKLSLHVLVISPDSYLMSGDDQPTCGSSGFPLIVKHMLVNCS